MISGREGPGDRLGRSWRAGTMGDASREAWLQAQEERVASGAVRGWEVRAYDKQNLRSK